MRVRINYKSERTTLGMTPYGQWLRGELDNRRGVENGKWVDFEYEWRSLSWTNMVPLVMNHYAHVNAEKWRSWSWEMKAFAFDELHE